VGLPPLLRIPLTVDLDRVSAEGHAALDQVRPVLRDRDVQLELILCEIRDDLGAGNGVELVEL
jgi:hypothetical protein